MHKQRKAFVFIFDVFTVSIIIFACVFIQFLFLIPAVYVIGFFGLMLLTSPALLAKHSWNHVELASLIGWVILCGWYLHDQAIFCLVLYLITRAVGDASTVLVSNTDRLFGILLRYTISSTLFIAGFSILNNARWYVLVMWCILCLALVSVLFRRYDVFDRDEVAGT